ncbi:sulfotransferase [Marinobacter metalliresistant]|uniref:Sulfotransferase n=1 Tax=Marinobacter metalliresistant TaxID=2961995 RepID=A0ABZ2W555_9GAMM
MRYKSLVQLFYNSYFKLQDFNSRKGLRSPVFIVGTGRSGTHFLCSCLNSFSELDDGFSGKESRYMFDRISELTVRQNPLSSSVRGYYSSMMRSVYPKTLVDQTHPNIWNVEQLKNWFPNARFLTLNRDVYSVVFSMINHPGVAAWEINHFKYPKPNRFLGITEKNRNIYCNRLSDIQRFVFRWCAHTERSMELIETYPDSVMGIRYEDLAADMVREMGKVADFLEIDPPNELQYFNEKSLLKKNSLSREQVREIDEALMLYKESGG